MKMPGELYARSPRLYHGLATLQYPLHDWTGTVTHCGRICYKTRKINLSQVFAGQDVGVKQVSDRIWLVTFMDYDLGYFDDETCRLEPVENPIRAESVTYVPGMNCYPCDRNRPSRTGAPGRTRTCDPRLRRPVLYPTELRARAEPRTHADRG
jgi:putative transposase